MNTSEIPILAGMRQKMQYLSERQALLAQNIANADTPGYQAKDLAKVDFGAAMEQAGGKLAMTKTNARHLGDAAGGASTFKVVSRKPYETNPNDNKVALDEEIQLLSMNQMDYQQVATMYRKTLELFKTAIGRPGG